MPHISLKLYPGRSKEEIERISKRLQDCLVEDVGWKPGDISVSVEEIESNQFVEKVKRDIASEEMVIPSDVLQ